MLFRTQAITVLVFTSVLCANASLCAQATLSPPTALIGQVGASHCELTDVDQDGDLDAVFASSQGTLIAVAINQGLGTFNTNNVVVSSPLLTNPQSLHLADLNNDGFPDLVTVPLSAAVPHYLEVSMGLGNGQFASAVSTLAGLTRVDKMKILDLNGDGFADIVMDSAQATNSEWIAWMRNDGFGGFSLPMTLAPGTAWFSRVLLTGDMDGDGDADYVLGDSGTRVRVGWNDGTGMASSWTTFGTTSNAYSAVSGVLHDFNGDGAAEVVIATARLNWSTTIAPQISYLANNGSGILAQSWARSLDTDLIGGSPTVVLGDFDNDGDQDVAVGAGLLNGGPLAPPPPIARFGFYDTAGGSLVNAAPTLTAAFPSMIRLPLVGDVDQDGDADLINQNETFGVRLDLDVAWNATARLEAGPVTPGGFTTVTLISPLDALKPYVCGFSFTASSGLPLGDGRLVPLDLDILLNFSLIPNNGLFLGMYGTLDSQGQATASVYITNDPAWSGLRIPGSFVVLDPLASSGVNRIAGPPVTLSVP